MSRKLLISLIAIFSLNFALLAQPGPGGGPGGPGPGGPGGGFGGRGGHGEPAPRTSAPNMKHSAHSFNGMRLSLVHDPFQVVIIETNTDSLRIFFNIPVNPASLRTKGIFINDESLDKSAELKFSKTGNLVEIQSELPSDTEFTLELKNVKSYDGEKLSVSKFESLEVGKHKEYKIPCPKSEYETK